MFARASGALAGIELLSKHLKNYRNFCERLVYSRIHSYSCLLSSYELCGVMRCSRGGRLQRRINTRVIGKFSLGVLLLTQECMITSYP